MEPWHALALRYCDEHEILGRAANPFILDCFRHTTFHATSDEIPWCSAFMCKIMDETGMISTGRADADSWNHYGSPCELKPGAIVVFRWPSGKRHVTLCHADTGGELAHFVGGNQHDMVKISVYEKKYIESIHWPMMVRATTTTGGLNEVP